VQMIKPPTSCPIVFVDLSLLFESCEKARRRCDPRHTPRSRRSPRPLPCNLAKKFR
jgi:hypothetical protein